MNLTELLTARVSPEMEKLLEHEVQARRAKGHRVNKADIIREALVEHFEEAPKNVSDGAILPPTNAHLEPAHV